MSDSPHRQSQLNLWLQPNQNSEPMQHNDRRRPSAGPCFGGRAASGQPQFLYGIVFHPIVLEFCVFSRTATLELAVRQPSHANRAKSPRRSAKARTDPHSRLFALAFWPVSTARNSRQLPPFLLRRCLTRRNASPAIRSIRLSSFVKCWVR